MTVLVAIPYYQAKAYIRKAVETALAQTHRDLVVMVAGDGDDPRPYLKDIHDPRLRVVSFPGNGGAPHIQQAMLLASPHEWYAAWGADDWGEPDYIERLLALGGDANATKAFWLHQANGKVVRRDDYIHGEYGVHRTEMLRSLGGYGIDRRCSQDSLLYTLLLPHITEIRWSDHPAFHKIRRRGSLTDPRSPTGRRSPYRVEVSKRNDRIRKHCIELGFDDLAAIREYRNSLVAQELLDSLAGRVRVCRAALK